MKRCLLTKFHLELTKDNFLKYFEDGRKYIHGANSSNIRVFSIFFCQRNNTGFLQIFGDFTICHPFIKYDSAFSYDSLPVDGILDPLYRQIINTSCLKTGILYCLRSFIFSDDSFLETKVDESLVYIILRMNAVWNAFHILNITYIVSVE